MRGENIAALLVRICDRTPILSRLPEDEAKELVHTPRILAPLPSASRSENFSIIFSDELRKGVH